MTVSRNKSEVSDGGRRLVGRRAKDRHEPERTGNPILRVQASMILGMSCPEAFWIPFQRSRVFPFPNAFSLR